MSSRARLSIIPAPAVTDTRLEPRDLQVLCLLGRHTDDRGWCRRSQVKMAEEIHCGRATLHRSLIRLRDAGYVEWRAETRPSGADSAHSYRVILDVADTPDVAVPTDGHHADSEGGAHGWAGGVPTQDGQGVPTHERAPMLTTPLNDKAERDARERASDPVDEEVPDPIFLDRILKAHPQAAHADQDDVHAAWRALNVEERAAAARLIEPWLASKSGKHPLGVAKYLRQKLWTLLPEAAPPKSNVTTKLRPFTPEWWFAWLRRVEACETVGFMSNEALGNRDWVVQGTGPSKAEADSLVPIPLNSPLHVAWERHLASVGIRLPRPLGAGAVWMPSKEPDPGFGAIKEPKVA